MYTKMILKNSIYKNKLNITKMILKNSIYFYKLNITMLENRELNKSYNNVLPVNMKYITFKDLEALYNNNKVNLEFYSFKNIINKGFYNLLRLICIKKDPTYFSECLLYACEKGDYKSVNILLNNNANPNITDKEGKTPIFYDLCCKSECLKLLLEYDADPNIKDKEGNTPLIYAVLYSNEESVKTLLKYNADPNIRSIYKSPLLLSIVQEKYNIVELLVEYGAKDNRCIRCDRCKKYILKKKSQIHNSDCSIECDKCHSLVKGISEYEYHKKYICQYSPNIICNKCGLIIKRDEINDHNNELCPTIKDYYYLRRSVGGNDVINELKNISDFDGWTLYISDSFYISSSSYKPKMTQLNNINTIDDLLEYLNKDITAGDIISCDINNETKTLSIYYSWK